jgi:hypothetical protein
VTVVRRRFAPVVVAAVLGVGIAGWWAVPWDLAGGSSGMLIAVVMPIARAASPAASVGVGGDTRSPGEGPGFVGAPLFAILGVLGLGVGTALLTLLYVRLTGGLSGRRPAAGPSPRDGPDSVGG